MVEADRIKSLIREADIYRDQGLLDQAKYKYNEALKLVQNNEALQKQEAIISSIIKRIKAVEAEIHELDRCTDAPELSEDVQNLISSLFSYSEDKDVAAIEGAVALAKFGQYEKAFSEFQRLIDERILPLRAAENMLRCQLFFISPERAVDQYKKWVSGPVFTIKELNALRKFMIKMFKREGIDLDLPATQESLPEEPGENAITMPVMEISSIGISMKDKFRRDIDVKLDITFQTGNILSFIVKANKRQLIDFLSVGARLPEIQCYSDMSFFQARGFISDRKVIPGGPRKGDYTFDLTMEKI